LQVEPCHSQVFHFGLKFRRADFGGGLFRSASRDSIDPGRIPEGIGRNPSTFQMIHQGRCPETQPRISDPPFS